LCAALALGMPAGESARPSPPFTMLRLGAPSLPFSRYRGKVIAVAFIQTTCAHCQQLTTELNLIARDYAGRGVQVLECAFNDDAVATMPEFLERFAPPFPVGYSTLAAVMAYLQYTIIDPHPLLVPQMVFIDRTGVIRAQYPGESDFFRNAGPNVRAQLDKMLGSGAAGRKQ
jgi:thiol-disulfide isomerase/thioredoxin